MLIFLKKNTVIQALVALVNDPEPEHPLRAGKALNLIDIAVK